MIGQALQEENHELKTYQPGHTKTWAIGEIGAFLGPSRARFMSHLTPPHLDLVIKPKSHYFRIFKVFVYNSEIFVYKAHFVALCVIGQALQEENHEVKTYQPGHVKTWAIGEIGAFLGPSHVRFRTISSPTINLVPSHRHLRIRNLI